MSAKHWLLPDGIEEILPANAQAVEILRRRLLDLYVSWGYDLVIPPLLEFTDSLLSGVGSDLNLLTLKVMDQLSGELMGLRADITPQAARIDAHSYVKSGPSRLCYADYVIHAKPKSPLAVRTPLQVGVELFGEPKLDADLEVISLLLASLDSIDVPQVTLDLGHVDICRSLAKALSLTSSQQTEFFDLLQTKDIAQIQHWSQSLNSAKASSWLPLLPTLCGDRHILTEARGVLAGAPAEVFVALDQLDEAYQIVSSRCPQVNIYFDLSELRGYHYHTGIVFAAYTDGFGDAIANGGRYDDIGEVFGRARPATGFAINLTSVLSLLSLDESVGGIYAPWSPDSPLGEAQWEAIQALRNQGERVVCGLSQPPNFDELRCDRQLVFDGGRYQVKPL